MVTGSSEVVIQPHLLDLASLPAPRFRDLYRRLTSPHRGALPHLQTRGALALLCGRPQPYVRAAVQAGASLLGLRVEVYGPGETAALGEPGMAGERLSIVHPLILGCGMAPGTLGALAAHSRVPVVDAGDGDADPVGALADLAVIDEAVGGLAGTKLAWVGDATGLFFDLLVGAATLGATVAVAHPVGFAPDPERVLVGRQRAAESGAAVLDTTDLAEGVQDARAVYVDLWPAEHVERFRPYAVQAHTLRDAGAGTGVVVLHRRPEQRGPELSPSFAEEITTRSVDQFRMRVAAFAAVLASLLEPDPLRSVTR